MSEWDDGFDQGYDLGTLNGEQKVREELGERIENIDRLREQFRAGRPYKAIYRGVADSRLVTTDGTEIAAFEFYSDAESVADILNVATEKNAAVATLMQARVAEKARVS